MSLSQNPSRQLSALEYYQHLNTKQVMGVIGASNVRTVWKYVEEGKLPKPHYPSPHRPVWRLGEVVDVFGQAPRAVMTLRRGRSGGVRSWGKSAAPEPVKEKTRGSSAAALNSGTARAEAAVGSTRL